MQKTANSTSVVAFPLYDGHGNMVSTLSRQAGSYATGNDRAFDAWGNIRNSDSSSDPKARYCANLGHKQDDESGLIYMRARYYDGTAGRFLSQDSSRQGLDWYLYCDNSSTNRVDSSGAAWYDWFLGAVGLVVFGICAALLCTAVVAASAFLIALCIIFMVASIVLDALEAWKISSEWREIDLGRSDPTGMATSMIDELKTRGGAVAIWGADLELIMWTGIALYGDDN